MPFTFVYVAKKKTGEPEKRNTKKTVSLFPKFCPFCGKETNIK